MKHIWKMSHIFTVTDFEEEIPVEGEESLENGASEGFRDHGLALLILKGETQS